MGDRKTRVDAPSRNGLREALLGLLAIRPMSGYDVSRSYTRALQQIWYSPQGQVYPTLRKMHADGLLEVTIEVQDGKPNRKVYSLTDEGKRVLVNWLSSPAALPRMHHEFIHKLFLLNHVPESEQLDFIRSYIEQTREWARDLRAIAKKLIPSLKGDYAESAWFQHLALEHLISIVEAEAKSAERIAAQFARHTKSKKTQSSRGESGIGTAFGGLSLSPSASKDGRSGAARGGRRGGRSDAGKK